MSDDPMTAVLSVIEPASTLSRRGQLFILSSPSGAGKTTLSRRLLERDKDIRLSVSATTRPMRPGEVEGKDYFFVTHERFEEMVHGGELLEHAHVFGNRYGTPRAPVDAALASGLDVLFDVDWQGAQQIREAAPDDTVSVFILPPSIDALEQRLRSRAQDDDETVARRMAAARAEISHWEEYQYVLVNRDLDMCSTQLAAVLTAERLRFARREHGVRAIVDGMGEMQ